MRCSWIMGTQAFIVLETGAVGLGPGQITSKIPLLFGGIDTSFSRSF